MTFASVMLADQLDDIIAQTQSVDAAVRIDAFIQLKPFLVAQPVDPRAVNALTQLLGLEVTQTSASDDDGDYVFDVMQSVVDLKDPSTIPALVDIIGTGNAVPAALAHFGAASLDLVISRISDADWIVRKCATIALIKMMDPSNPARISNPAGLHKDRLSFPAGKLGPEPLRVGRRSRRHSEVGNRDVHGRGFRRRAAVSHLLRRGEPDV
jgi:hypothetical protein